MPKNAATETWKNDKELVDLLATPPEKLCVIGIILRDHPNGKEIAAAVDSPEWSAAKLSVILTRKIQATSAAAVVKHRMSQCRCFPAGSLNG